MTTNEIAARRETAVKTQSRLSRKTLIVGGALLFGVVVFLRVYEQIFAWSLGLDSFAPEFQLYWGSLLTIGSLAALLGAVGLAAYFWRSRDRRLDELAPAAEVSRLFTLVQWLVLFALALYFGLSFFTEQTAVWHMTAVRDTDFTPSNIVTFYIAYPLYVAIGVGAYFYAATRLPSFSKGYSLPFVILVVGAFMEIPNVGFNEWGHTFWFMDEGFAGPLHWGFVFFGWMALGVFGVVLQILARLRVLLGAEGVRALLTST